jgi:hypothetical protein
MRNHVDGESVLMEKVGSFDKVRRWTKKCVDGESV